MADFINEMFHIELTMYELTDCPSIQAVTEYLLKEYAGAIRNLFPNEVMEGSQSESVVLRDLAYTTQSGREAMEARAAITGTSLKEMKDKLFEFCRGDKQVPGVYVHQQSADAFAEKMKVLTEGTAGELFVKTIIENGDAEKLAQLWVWGRMSTGNPFINIYSSRVNGSQFRLIRLQKNVIGFRPGLRRQRSLSILFNITCKKMEGESVCKSIRNKRVRTDSSICKSRHRINCPLYLFGYRSGESDCHQTSLFIYKTL